MFSCTYFIVDTLDAAAGRRWAMLVAHHLPTLILFGSEALFPRMLQLKYASRIMIIEISTPLLTRWRRSRRKKRLGKKRRLNGYKLKMIQNVQKMH